MLFILEESGTDSPKLYEITWICIIMTTLQVVQVIYYACLTAYEDLKIWWLSHVLVFLNLMEINIFFYYMAQHYLSMKILMVNSKCNIRLAVLKLSTISKWNLLVHDVSTRLSSSTSFLLSTDSWSIIFTLLANIANFPVRCNCFPRPIYWYSAHHSCSRWCHTTL